VRAWYLDCGPEDVADRAILVGDPGRTDLFGEHLDSARVVGENRGLRTITGTCQGKRVTVCAFGMGAPVAVIVLEELAQLGVRTVLRAGTVMTLLPEGLGELIVARGAVREEGTSRGYLPESFPAVPDPDLLFSTLVALERLDIPHRVGLVASLDVFYGQMFAREPEQRPAVTARLAGLAAGGVIAVDMETSAILTTASRLGVRAGSVCLGSVDGSRGVRLEGDRRVQGEDRLAEAALAAITAPEGDLGRAVGLWARAPATEDPAPATSADPAAARRADPPTREES
jgi:uridine phosphorylase